MNARDDRARRIEELVDEIVVRTPSAHREVVRRALFEPAGGMGVVGTTNPEVEPFLAELIALRNAESDESSGPRRD